jgi:hypothetical protein
MKFALLIPISLLIGACAPRTGPSILPNSRVAAPNDVGFLPQQAEKGALFQYYQPKAGSKWRNNWTSRFDLTGVSWNDARDVDFSQPRRDGRALHATFRRRGHVP